MPSYYPLTNAVCLADLRLDLSDTNPASYRWTDADLNRAIDRALEAYSRANPQMLSVQIPTVAQCILYPFPSGAGFIHQVEYPVGNWPKSYRPFRVSKTPSLAPPSSFSLTGAYNGPGGGILLAGNYNYKVTFLTAAGGESLPSPAFTLTSGGSFASCSISGIPTGPYGTTARNIYRTAAGGSTYQYLGQIADNTTTTFLDTFPDATATHLPPSVDSTGGWDQLELQIPAGLWPADTTGVIEITYATKHLLDATGTTVPERHWDVLFQGALAFAMLAYLPQVNDNFEYADGHLRDRVDDTKSTVAWHIQCQQATADFNAKLKRVMEEAAAGINSTLTHWGDKPLRWEQV